VHKRAEDGSKAAIEKAYKVVESSFKGLRTALSIHEAGLVVTSLV
jgi:hypothetical protein